MEGREGEKGNEIGRVAEKIVPKQAFSRKPMEFRSCRLLPEVNVTKVPKLGERSKYVEKRYSLIFRVHIHQLFVAHFSILFVRFVFRLLETVLFFPQC